MSLFVTFILSIVFLIFLFHYLIDNKIIKIKNSLIKIYPIFFLPALLIFAAGSDFGRWFNILGFHLLAFYLVLNIDNKKKIKFSLNNWILIWILLFSYIFLWTLPAGCCFWEGQVFRSSLFNQFYYLILDTYQYVNTNIFELPLNNFLK